MKIEILHDDSINYLKNIRSNSVDLIIADPPYNLGKDYGNNNDTKSFDEYMSFSKGWVKEAYRILKNTGLKQPFNGFDSIDERMERVPNDLNDENIRKEYLKNHKDWFLKYHPNAIDVFENEVRKKYGNKTIRERDLFESMA